MTRTTAALALAMTALAGCNPTRSDLRRRAEEVSATVFNAPGNGIGGGNANRPGRVIEPKFCRVDSAILLRPVGDKVVDESPWNVADEQVIPGEVRQALEANGLRVGVITGALPAEILEAFKPSPPRKETPWVHIALPVGVPSPIELGGKTESVSLLLNHRGKVDGRDYRDASGRIVLTAGHSGPHDIALRLIPEIHHGAERRTIAALQNTSRFEPKEFAIKDGQQEDILRDLATSIDVKPGQTVVVGCRSGHARSLGTMLFLQPDPDGGERMLQGLLLLQAARNNDGTPPPLRPDEEANDGPDLAVKPVTAASKGWKLAGDEPGR